MDSPGQDSQGNGDNMDDIEYDEMDLTPYEEDDDATLHKKLCAAKVARKRAEEDLKLLCNRIGLLKMEEGKVRTGFKNSTLGVAAESNWSNLISLCHYIGRQEDRRDTQACKPDRFSAVAQHHDLAAEGRPSAQAGDGRGHETADEPSDEGAGQPAGRQ